MLQLLYSQGRKVTTTVYKDINSFITNYHDCYERESPTARINATWRYIYSEPCFFYGRFDTEQFLNQKPTFPTSGKHPAGATCLLSWLPNSIDWTDPVIEKLPSLHIFRTPTHFSFQHNSHDSFQLSLVYLKAHILFMKSTLTGCQRSICNTVTKIFITQ